MPELTDWHDGYHDGRMDTESESERLRERVEALEADKARLVAALYDATNTLGLWEPAPQPALKRASAVLSEMKGGADER